MLELGGRLVMVMAASWRSPGTMSAFIPLSPASVPIMDSMEVICSEDFEDMVLGELLVPVRVVIARGGLVGCVLDLDFELDEMKEWLRLRVLD